MAIIQRSDLVERIRRAFGLREQGVGATLSPELVPVVLVDDLTGPSIDTGFPRDVVGRASAGASVGVFAEALVTNPDDSRVDLVLYELWVRRINTAGTFQVRWGANTSLSSLLGTQGWMQNEDLRVRNNNANTRLDARNQAAVMTPSKVLYQQLTTSTSFTVLPLQVTLPPGYWLEAHPAVNNEGVEVVFWGYERLRTTT